MRQPPMIEHYAHIKAIHVGAVLASGALFVIRGVLVLAGSRAAIGTRLRHLSYGIDSVLLAAAVTLLLLLRWLPLEQPWLLAKLGLLPAYVVAGSFALKRARSNVARAACFATALLIYAWMLGIAWRHDPGSWLQGLGGP